MVLLLSLDNKFANLVIYFHMTLALNRKRIQLLALLSLALAFAVIYLIFVPHTFAQSASPTPKQIRADIKEDRDDLKIAIADEKRLKVCQIHERNIKNRAEHLQALVDKMFDKFDRIATRVENFYTTKLVPQGKTLPNYTALVADIATKKAAVTTAVEKAKADIAGFSCTTSADPKADMTTYRLDMQAVKSALQDYRKSIRNLIVAVRGLAGESASPSASPTATP